MSKEINQESVENLLLQTIAKILEETDNLVLETSSARFPYLQALDTLSQSYQRIKSVNK